MLIDVPEQLPRHHADVRPVDSPLEQRPEVFHPVGVNVATDVLAGMVNRLVDVVARQAFVGFEGVRIHRRSLRDDTADVRHESLPLRVADNSSNHATATLQHALNNRLPHRATAFDAGGPCELVHVLGLAANESFVSLASAGHLQERTVLHRQADAVKHVPSRLLSDPKVSGEFVTADAVLAIRGTPHSDEPLVQAERGILENRPDLVTELLSAVASPASQHSSGLQFTDVVATTFGAGDLAFRPLDLFHVLVAEINVREVFDGINQGLRGVAHDSASRCLNVTAELYSRGLVESSILSPFFSPTETERRTVTSRLADQNSLTPCETRQTTPK